ncbi:hypothetical protein GGI12_004079 [Dipsacomyces acuminosporus]|nr:hypothetical protein GGI12_004079 [Dipsacomyces acuminosporus]
MDIASLAPRVRSILQGSDLATVSAKKVRRQLEAELNMSLDANKTQIDKIIMDQFHQIHNETQNRQQQLQQQQQQYAQQHQAQMSLYGVTPQMTGLHVPQSGYSNVMHHPGAASMVPGLGAHGGAPGLIPGMGPGGSLSPDAAPRKRGRPRKPENEKKQLRKKREVDPNKPKRQTGLSKPMKLSATLNAFLGQKYCARTDVVKNLWKYIKEHNLQDPNDKRYILCDDKLRELFDTDRLYMYTMNKLLNQHLTKPTPEENAEAIVLLGLPPTHPAAADSIGIVHGTGSSAAAPAADDAADDDDDEGHGDGEDEDEEAKSGPSTPASESHVAENGESAKHEQQQAAPPPATTTTTTATTASGSGAKSDAPGADAKPNATSGSASAVAAGTGPQLALPPALEQKPPVASSEVNGTHTSS